MSKFGYPVIDADGHGGEFADWRNQVPERFTPTVTAYMEKIRKHYGRLALPGGGKEVIARHDVKSTRTSELSMMPEGIEALLDRRELADLFAFLALDHAPGDPRARPIHGTPERKPVTASPSTTTRSALLRSRPY